MPVKGKQVTDTPEILLKSELTYDNGAFFASANVNYTDERFYTYLNEGSVDAYTLREPRRRLSLPRLRRVRGAVVQADATNVTDKEYFSTIDSNGFTEPDPNGTCAVAAARRAAAVLPVGEGEVLRRCRDPGTILCFLLCRAVIPASDS